jgi:hypothetical protein
MDTNKLNLQDRLQDIQYKYQKACQQIKILDRQLDTMQHRYDIATQERSRAVYHSLRLQLATLEGVRSAFYEYACWKAAEKKELRMKISAEYISHQRQHR